MAFLKKFHFYLQIKNEPISSTVEIMEESSSTIESPLMPLVITIDDDDENMEIIETCPELVQNPTLNEIKTESSHDYHLANEPDKKIKENPLIITLDDDDDSMDIVEMSPEPKLEVPEMPLVENPFSVDVKPFHHELLIEDVTEEEIGSQSGSGIQFQQNFIKEEFLQMRAESDEQLEEQSQFHESLMEDFKPLHQELHIIDINEAEEQDEDETSNAKVPDNEFNINLNEQELKICQFLLRQSEPIMGDLGHIFQMNKIFQVTK